MSGLQPTHDGSLNVLLIEDNPGDARLIDLILEEADGCRYQLRQTGTLADGLVQLRAAPADVALVDLGLPDSQGLATCARVVAAAPATAVLVLTGQNDGELAVAALQAGAQDYLVKGQVDAPLLARALRYALERKRISNKLEQVLEEKRALVAALEQANRELDESRAQQAELAIHDPLTGLFNRRAMDRFLQDELARVSRYGHPLALIILDLDHFKCVNDTYGHPAGDQVLAALARLLTEMLRPNDRLIRYGGEEFAVIAPVMPVEQGLRLADRLRVQVAATPFPIVRADGGTQPLNLTVSLGLAFVPTHATDAKGLLAAADAALYEAKRRGRNRLATPKLAPDLAMTPRPNQDPSKHP